jgi:tRNA(Phe) wybutosine-synthesizing methylase Tyw3
MGRPKKENTELINFRIDSEAADSLKQLAKECGFKYGEGAAMGAFLERLAIADRDLLKILIKKAAPPLDE